MRRALIVIALVALGLPAAADARTRTRTFSSGDLALPIVGSSTEPTIVSVNRHVPNRGKVRDVNVFVRLDYTRDRKLDLAIWDPSGNHSLLSLRTGDGPNFGSGPMSCAGTFTVFDDSAATGIAAGTPPFAGSFKPQTELSHLRGDKTRGTWRFEITRFPPLPFESDAGTLFCFTLSIRYKPA